MSNSIVKTRIRLKHAYEADWNKATGFIPLAGELIIYDADRDIPEDAPPNVRGVYNRPRFKVGDGRTAVTELPFASNCELPVTYDELKSLRNSAELIPGMYYRITNYECTTTQPDTAAAAHHFDIIVQALSNNTLSETASADYHLENGTPDGYFMTEKFIPAVEWLYTIEDDGQGIGFYEGGSRGDSIVKCDYAENNEGVTVPILYKNDETNYPGEVDYDDVFYYVGTYAVDGEHYDRWRKIDSEAAWDADPRFYILTNIIVNNNTFLPGVETGKVIGQPVANLPAWELKYCLDNNTDRFAWADPDSGKGIIYYMKDEYGNECPYDFKNIMFERNQDWQEYYTEFFDATGLSVDFAAGDITWFYTFSWVNSGLNVYDLTVRQDLQTDDGLYAGTRNNSISERTNDAGQQVLSENLFIATAYYDNGFYYGFNDNKLKTNCYNNTFCNACNNNTFGTGCYGNTFCNSCSNNTFGNECYRNTFGDSFYDNTFSTYCYNNTFGSDCHNNTFGSDCRNNTFGNCCYHNTFGDSVCDNTFGSDFDNNTFGTGCNNNTFGTGCRNNLFGIGGGGNSFGDSCSNNIFGHDFDGNTFDDGCYHNTFGNNCTDNTFGSNCDNNTFGNNCHRNTINSHSHTNTFGNICNDNTFGNASLRNTFGQNCYNNTFGYGCSDNTFGNDCFHNTYGNECSNNTFGNECRYNTFGPECLNNTFSNNCYRNNFDIRCSSNRLHADCYYIDLTATTTTGTVHYVTIGPGIGGTSENRLQLTVTRNWAPVVFEAKNTKYIILD